MNTRQEWRGFLDVSYARLSVILGWGKRSSKLQTSVQVSAVPKRTVSLEIEILHTDLHI